jgi:NAD dependent epimerase/dehydratase family enzyme
MARIIVAGGTGLLGTALAEALRLDGHSVVALSRRPTHPHEVRWSPAEGLGAWTSALDDAQAVVNLAGVSIASGRWTAARKAAIRESRRQATGALVRAITAADVCREWEAIALQASPVSRVVLLRSGVVLARNGGALPQLALPFKLFAGGPAGTGQQFLSWIHMHDWVTMVKWALATPTVEGALNVTAPAPVTNEEFSRTLGRVLGRPSLLRAPAFALRLVLGEMADALVLGGQRVLPEVARERGFVFSYPTLEPALREIYR